MAIKLGSPLLVDPTEEEGPSQYAAGMQPEVDSDKFLLYIAPATFWALFLAGIVHDSGSFFSGPFLAGGGTSELGERGSQCI